MTNQVAADVLKNTAWLGTERDLDDVTEAVRMAISALEKQTPKQLIAEDNSGGQRMTELDYARLKLDNLINGMEISKSALPEFWTDEDEERLKLMVLIRGILGRIKEGE